MKKQLAKFVSFLLIFSILLCNPFVVYASDHGGGGSSSSRNLIKAQESIENREKIEKFFKEYFADVNGFFVYAASQVGAVLSGDYSGAYQSYLTMDDIINSTGLYVDDNGNPTDFYISSDLMEQIKSLLDQYAKENEPYYFGYTYSLYTSSLSTFYNQKNLYDTVKNLIEDSPNGLIRIIFTSYNGGVLLQVSEYPDIKDIGFVKKPNSSDMYTNAYSISTWKIVDNPVYMLELYPDDPAIESFADLKSRAEVQSSSSNGLIHKFASTSNSTRVSPLSGYLSVMSYYQTRFRIYKNTDDFMNATLGKRHVYYTSNYYDYTPSEITVSTEELEQGINDINTALDKLLEQIDANTSESDIENILQQILDELKNDHSGGSGTGGGGAGGTGTGGSTVDMSTTNSWLEKIYNKVCNIFDKMGQKDEDNTSVSENSVGMSDINNVLKLIWANTNVIVEKLMSGDSVSGNSVSGNSIDLSGTNSILDSIKASLDDIHETLKKLKRWSAVDTVIDGVDAIADWFGLIHDILADADAGAESAVSSISSALGDAAGLMTKKFPFSIPWDLFFLISFFSAEPEVPYFEIPFRVPYYDFEYTFVVDFGDYQWLSDVIRPILLMSYAIGLLSKTPSILSIGKEE